MSKVLIVGNSHTGALKLGWEACKKDFPATNLEFFVATSAPYEHFVLERSGVFGLPADADTRPGLARYAKVVESINGKRTVNLNDYDLVIRVGYHWQFKHLSDVLRKHSIDGLHEADAPRYMSAAAYQAVCRSIAETAVPDGNWLRLKGTKLVVVMRPIPAESCLLGDEPGTYGGWRAILRNGQSIKPALDVFISELESAHLRAGIDFVQQPPETIGTLGMTKAGYTRGSVRLVSGEEHPTEDHGHMNAEYGTLVMRDLLDRIGATAPVQ